MTGRGWFWFSVAAFVAALAWSAAALPARVPVHFGATGEADRFTSRTQALVELGAIGLFVVLVFLGCERFARRGSLAWVNVPHKDYWTRPENEPTLRRMLADDMWVIGTATVLLLVALAVQVALVAHDPAPRLGPAFWVSLGVYVAVVVVWSVRMVTHRYRPPENS